VGEDERIVVFDAVRGWRIARVLAASPSDNGTSLMEYRLSRSGFFVWIQGPAGNAPGSSKLSAHDSHGTRRLDVGAITSLALSGETVTWTNGAMTHTAHLG